MTVWGRPRFTADIDVVIEVLPGKAAALIQSLRTLGADVAVDLASVAEAVQAQEEFNVVDVSSGLKVDFWILRDEPFDRERMGRRVKRMVAGQALYFSSPEDLILIKLRWYKERGSTRQLEDIESIVRVQRVLDLDYLRRWASQQSTKATLETILEKQ